MIFLQLSHQLSLLGGLIEKISESQFQQKIQHLSDGSIGAHTRHVIELLQCAVAGHVTGEVDYINRSRNLELERNPSAALAELRWLDANFRLNDKQLTVALEQQLYEEQLVVYTTYFRELIYNTEHAVHHLALIKVALVEMNLRLVDDSFGMAASTIKYKATISPA